MGEAHNKALSQKMVALGSFALVIERFPIVLKQRMLLHSPEVQLQENVYMQWISKEEATSAHQKLEACRDAICEEKVMRKLKASLRSQGSSDGSWDVLSHDRVQLLFGRNDD